MRVRFLQKSVSLVTVFCFLWTTVFQSFSISLAVAQTIQTPASTSPVEGIRLSIPSELGKVEEVFIGRAAEEGIKPLILIQDAHANPSAQIHIAKILKTISDQKPYRYIFLEAGYGDESLEFIREYSALTRRKEVALSLVKKNKLQGVENLAEKGIK